MIYLDYNATAPLRPAVQTAMQAAMAQPCNASSAHKLGRDAKKMVENTRRKLAETLNCWPQEIIWCGSATEANNAVVAQFCSPQAPSTGLSSLSSKRGDNPILVSSIEHSATLNAAPNLEHIPVTTSGVVGVAWLEQRLSQPNKPALISVMLVNNETGVIQPLAEIVKIARQHGVLVHTDAVQAAGKMPLDMTMLGVDYMTISFHKNGGPQGIAALIVKNGAPFAPFIRGGGQEYNRRAGTENVVAIAGVDALLNDWSIDEYQKVSGMVASMESQLPDVTIIGKGAPRIGNTACLIMPGISQEVQLMRLDLAGICVGAGSACTSGKIEPSHVLTAMGIEKSLAANAIRISAGWASSQADCDAFVKEYKAMFTSLGGGATVPA